MLEKTSCELEVAIGIMQLQCDQNLPSLNLCSSEWEGGGVQSHRLEEQHYQRYVKYVACAYVASQHKI